MTLPPAQGGVVVAGRYLLYGQIGAGGMATVHLGSQIGTAGFSRTVAIKRLLPQYARDQAFVSMLVDEARLAARIRHPNVVPILDCVADDGQLLLVMEFVAGESLLSICRATSVAAAKIPPPVASAIVASALHGLHAAHEARDEYGQPLGIVHRDVSPHNILVGADGVARVIDFGIAKAAGRLQTTAQGTVKGKLGYMAPEQLSAKGVSRQTDVYAAAVVLWEALTCERLFGGDLDAVTLGRVLEGVVAPPSSRARDISAALDAVVLRGLDRDPARRFGTAEEMARALEVACPPATTSEVGAWVGRTIGPALAELARRVAEVEGASAATRTPGERPRVSTPPPKVLDMAATIPQAPTVLSASFSVPERAWPSLPAPPVQSPPAAAKISTLVLAAATFGAVLVAATAVAVYLAVVSRDRQAAEPAAVAAASATPSVASPPPVASAAPPVVSSAPPLAATCPRGMVPIPGGKFFMGSDEKDALPFEKPAHKVVLSPYCIDRFEVTVEEYVACSAGGSCRRAASTNEGWDQEVTRAQHTAYDPLCNAKFEDARRDHPINCVSWDMADTFCRTRGARLPTEAEWEFAARGPDGRKYPWGDDEPTAKRLNACGAECVAWGKAHGVPAETSPSMYKDDDGYPTTAPVGSFPEGKSRYGVEDVVGNVWEWVADWYGPYPDASDGREWNNPKGPDDGDRRVIRGGAWNGTQAAWVRPTFRYRAKPGMLSHGIGFRCGKSI